MKEYSNDRFVYICTYVESKSVVKNGKYFKYRLITYLSLRQSLRLCYVITGPEIQQSIEPCESRCLK